MKKQLFIISIIVVIVSIFVSCSANSSSDTVSTTAVTDSNGTTHYYQPITDYNGNVSTTSKNQGVLFAEIETQLNGKAVTEKNGKYITNEHTTVLPIVNTTDNSSKTTKSTTEKSSDATNNNADNNIEFELDKTTDKNENTTDGASPIPTKKETQPATDKDGWITKWY